MAKRSVCAHVFLALAKFLTNRTSSSWSPPRGTGYGALAVPAGTPANSPPIGLGALLFVTPDIQVDVGWARRNVGEMERSPSRSYAYSRSGGIEIDADSSVATGEPEGVLVHEGQAPRINATILSLVRNSELEGMISSMRDLERTWNRKFNYPWTFFNDQPFTEEFKRRTRAETKAECRYELIPKEHWDVPSWINNDIFLESAKMLTEHEVQYADMMSYHKMCRWNSGMFYKHPALKDIRYYWRVEPKVHFFCDVDYDVFRYMHDNNKTYGFVINLYDSPDTIETLWPETMKFAAAHPEYFHPESAIGWLTDSKRRPDHNRKANGYSTCHFWSNFEIADLNFWRSKPYEDYFAHLDRAGGFFYERWGDAPVHSIALALFEDSSKIHWFRDIGYQHIPYFNCPNSTKCKGCETGLFTDGEKFLYKEDCRPNWFEYASMD